MKLFRILSICTLSFLLLHSPDLQFDLMKSSLIRSLPKAELHLHLEGSVTPQTLVELRQRHGKQSSLAEAESLYQYKDFSGFLMAFKTLSEDLRTPEDYEFITYRLMEQLKAMKESLAKSAEENKYDFKILNAVMDVNEIQKKVLVEKLRDYYKDGLKGKKFALWGLAFKPETDDIREAPALYIIDELLKDGAEVVAHVAGQASSRRRCGAAECRQVDPV